MHMLAGLVELVIGVDTHNDTHTAAVVAAATGAVITKMTVPVTPAGYQQLLQVAAHQPGQQVWAIEGTGGYGAGLTASCTPTPSRWWSWTGPSGLPAATAPNPTRSMPSGRPVRP
jgi:Transposase